MKKLITASLFLLISTNAAASFITPSSVSSSTVYPTPPYNNVNALIENATDTSYVAPNPSGGGGGTSTWNSLPYNTWTFNFDSAYTLDTAYIWDYYQHSPTGWELNFFDGLNASGTNLGLYAFSITPCGGSCSTLHTISFGDVSNVQSVTLANTNTSAWTGVGLAEVHFGGANAVPEPATLALMGLGLAGLGFRRKKQA